MKKGTKNRQKNFVNAQKYGDDFYLKEKMLWTNF